MELQPLNKIPRTRSNIVSSKHYLSISKDDGAMHYDALNTSLYRNSEFEGEFYDIISVISKRNKNRLRRGSLIYFRILNSIVTAYVKTLMTVIVNVVIKGDEIVLDKSISLKISDMPIDQVFSRTTKYIYKHRLMGIFPKMRVALSSVFKKKLIDASRDDKRLLIVEGEMNIDMYNMTAARIINEGQRFTNDWNSLYKEKRRVLK